MYIGKRGKAHGNVFEISCSPSLKGQSRWADVAAYPKVFSSSLDDPLHDCAFVEDALVKE